MNMEYKSSGSQSVVFKKQILILFELIEGIVQEEGQRMGCVEEGGCEALINDRAGSNDLLKLAVSEARRYFVCVLVVVFEI
jgi:hypothetical protein